MSRMEKTGASFARALLAASALCAVFAPLVAKAEGVETVVVTAEKRAENLQNTPIAITALTAEKIATQNILGPEQLQFNVPSMTFGQQSSFSFISLRGISTDTSTTSAEPSVATYEDGVYTGTAFVQNLPSFDLERIEVLRGPQGTLYGRNADGGVVNFISRLPSFDKGANANFTYGSFNTLQIDLGATGGLIDDTVAGRISVRYLRHDGYRYNLALNDREYALDHVSGRAALLIKPEEDVSIVLRASVVHQKDTDAYGLITTASLDGFTSPSSPLGIFDLPAATLSAFGLISPTDKARLDSTVHGGSIADYYSHVTGDPVVRPGPIPPNPFEKSDISSTLPAFYKVDNQTYSATVDWNLPDVDVKSITAYRYSRLFFNQDSTGFGTPEVAFYPFEQNARQFTQEFDFSGKAFDDKLDWLAGAFYLQDNSDVSINIFLPGSSDAAKIGFSYGAAPGSPFAFNLAQPALPNLFQIFAADPLTTVVRDGPDWTGGTVKAFVTDPSTGFLGFAAKQRSQSIAGFSQLTYHITDQLRITGGLRYTTDDKRVDRTLHSNLIATFIDFGALTPVAPDGTPRLCDHQKNSKSWDALTGTADIDYDVEKDTMVYAKYSRGYKAGGFNPGECGAPFDPEHLTAYEGGIKSVFWDGQVLTNAALYYYDYSNIQFTLFIPNQSFIRNAGTAKAWGAEIEYQFVPQAAPGLEFDGSASFEHSGYGAGAFSDPALIVPTPPGISIRGNELIRAPKAKLNFAAQYGWDTGDWGGLLLRGETSYTDTIYNDIFNGKAPFEAAFTQPSYWVVNARLVWTSPDSHYEGQLFVENLTDAYYATNRVGFNTPSALDTIAGQFAPPMTYGVRFAMKFGGQ